MSEPLSYQTFQTSDQQGVLTLALCSGKSVPLIVLISGAPDVKQLLESCRKHGTPAFNLLSVSQIRWDEDLSPWPSKPVVMADDHFTGEASAFLKWIETKALPWALSKLPEAPEWTGLAGYSMGGLFAVYAALENAPFDAYASVSGSLWYPDFAAWALERKLSRKPLAIYFSLGNTETKSPNPYLQTTGRHTQTIEEYFAEQGVPSLFERNPGNHFQNPPARIAKALRWLLETLKRPEKKQSEKGE